MEYTAGSMSIINPTEEEHFTGVTERSMREIFRQVLSMGKGGGLPKTNHMLGNGNRTNQKDKA